MKTRWKLKISGGWYKGNPIHGITLALFEPVEDYPTGWMAIYIVLIQVIRFEAFIVLDKVEVKDGR